MSTTRVRPDGTPASQPSPLWMRLASDWRAVSAAERGCRLAAPAAANITTTPAQTVKVRIGKSLPQHELVFGSAAMRLSGPKRQGRWRVVPVGAGWQRTKIPNYSFAPFGILP